MKIQSLFVFVFGCLLGFMACNNDPSTPNASPSPSDTTSRNTEGHAENGDTASLQNLIKKYDPPGRMVWQRPEVVIQKMGDLENKTIADIGAGTGIFARRLAQQAKKVIALEIDPRFIHLMDSIKRAELKPEFQDRFETRLATPTNSNLKPGEADIVLIVNTFIYIQDRVAYLKHLRDVLPDGGEIIVVDFKKKRIPIKYPPTNVRLELFEVENELEAAGFTNIVSDDCALDYQYIVTAIK